MWVIALTDALLSSWVIVVTYIYIFFALHVYVAYSFPKKSHNWKSLGNPITLPIIANKGKTKVNVRWESISMNYNEHISFYILYSKIDYMWI